MTDEVEALVAEYAAWMVSWNASETTVRARAKMARSRLLEWGGVSGVTSDNIAAFIGRPGLAKWSRATYHSNLNDFCSWLVATERVTANPMENVRSPIRPKSRPRPLTEAEVDRVLQVADGKTRDWIDFALLAGLRASEIAALRGEDVQRDGIYVIGKGETRVTLPCHPDLWEIAQRYPRAGWWFPGAQSGHINSEQVSLTVGRLFRRLGISGSIHRCRHVYGTRLLRAGVHIRKVQQLMRHASLQTTAGYTAVDEDELRDAILQLPSLPPRPAA